MNSIISITFKKLHVFHYGSTQRFSGLRLVHTLFGRGKGKGNKDAWTKSKIPPQNGKLAIVTGTSVGGLGYETALMLAEKGSTVILASRNPSKGKETIEKIKAEVPKADLVFEKVDLGSLASVAEFCSRFNSQNKPLDLLINNAGVMALPKRLTTVDGFEMQFGTNYLSHFALTAQLLPALRKSTKKPRVVNVSSLAHWNGKINFKDLQFEKRYWRWLAYGQSKLANLMFTLELQRRSDAGGWGLLSTCAHPGYARTELFANGPGSWILLANKRLVHPLAISHSAADGALPTLYAATSPEATPGGYYGPSGFCEMKGPPAPGYIADQAKNIETAKKLWDISVTLTKVTWP